MNSAIVGRYVVDIGDRCYNGSVTPHDDGYLMAYRPNIGPILWVKLNSNFELNGPLLGKIKGIDPKLIKVKDQLKIITSYPYNGPLNEFVEINDISEDLQVVSDSSHKQLTIYNYPNYSPIRQKSWSPFQYNDELYFVYTKNIHHVIKYNTTINNVEYDENMVFTNYTSMETIFGSPLNGDGNAILFNNDFFITTFHTKKKRHYDVGYYLFDNKYPFVPRLYGKFLLIEGLQYASNTPKPKNTFCSRLFDTCVFPGGWFDSNGDTIKLSFGVNDQENHILEFSKERLLKNCNHFEQIS